MNSESGKFYLKSIGGSDLDATIEGIPTYFSTLRTVKAVAPDPITRDLYNLWFGKQVFIAS